MQEPLLPSERARGREPKKPPPMRLSTMISNHGTTLVNLRGPHPEHSKKTLVRRVGGIGATEKKYILFHRPTQDSAIIGVFSPSP